MVALPVINTVAESIENWTDVCQVAHILLFTGVAALIKGQQVAVFRLALPQECYAISNFDPFSRAYVMARGLVGDKGGTLKVASPIYKHTFSLLTGQCLEDEHVRLETWPVRVIDGCVQIAL